MMSTIKYRNTKLSTPDGKFDSKREYKRWNELKLLVKAGHISALIRQPKYELHPKFRDNRGVAQRAITYSPDFQYVDVPSGMTVVEDVKGFANDRFSMKEKMFRYKYPQIDFRVIK